MLRFLISKFSYLKLNQSINISRSPEELYKVDLNRTRVL